MKLLLGLVALHLISCIRSEDQSFDDHCRQTLEKAKQTIRRVSHAIAAKETTRLAKLIETTRNVLLEQYLKETEGHSDQFREFISQRDEGGCPQPNITIFTKATTTTPSTTTPLPTTTTPSTTPADAGTTSQEDATSTSSTPPEIIFRSPKIYGSERDPFAAYMDSLYYYMDRAEHVCHNQFTDLNSITEDQLFGFFATLATSNPGPFCSLCHRFVDTVKEKVFAIPRFGLSEAEKAMTKLIYDHIPETRSICGAVAPACYDNYDDQVRNLTTSVICFECTACMSVTNVLQMRFFLQPDMVEKALPYVRGNVFHNLCAEICLRIGFPYDICLNYITSRYHNIINVATTILRPERFCGLELQWCELNEAPNGLHCLRELCLEYYKDTPQTRWLCSQIPDSPEAANKFLNINNKISKTLKPYHDTFLNSYQHSEL